MTLNDLIEDLYIYVPNAPEQILKRAYVDAAREFMKETRAWRPVVTSITVVDGKTDEYTLAPPSDAEFFDTIFVDYKDDRLPKATYAQIRRRVSPHSMNPEYHRFVHADTVQISADPGADISADLLVRAVARPTKTATEISDWVLEHFQESLDYGALTRLYRMPNRDWTSFDLSEKFEGLFREAINRNTSLAQDDMQTGVPRTVRYGGL